MDVRGGTEWITRTAKIFTPVHLNTVRNRQSWVSTTAHVLYISNTYDHKSEALKSVLDKLHVGWYQHNVRALQSK